MKRKMEFHLEAGEELLINKRKKSNTKRISVTMISNGYYTKNYKRETMDAMEYIQLMNPKSDESKVYTHLIQVRNTNDNSCIIGLSMEDKKKYFYKGIKKLNDDDIVRKIANSVYMINPFFITPFDMCETLVLKWDSLKQSNPTRAEEVLNKKTYEKKENKNERPGRIKAESDENPFK